MITWEYVLGFILLYTVLATIVQKKDWIPDSFSIWGPILTIRSEIGLDTIESLANRYYKFWVPWGTIRCFCFNSNSICWCILRRRICIWCYYAAK